MCFHWFKSWLDWERCHLPHHWWAWSVLSCFCEGRFLFFSSKPRALVNTCTFCWYLKNDYLFIQEVSHLHAAAVLMTVVMVVAILSSIAIVRRILMATSVLKASQIPGLHILYCNRMFVTCVDEYVLLKKCVLIYSQVSYILYIHAKRNNFVFFFTGCCKGHWGGPSINYLSGHTICHSCNFLYVLAFCCTQSF